MIWVSLWFVLLGGYIYFSHTIWQGLVFLATVSFVPALICLLVDTFAWAPRLLALELKTSEAVLPLKLRKGMFVTFIITAFSLIGSVVFISIYFAKS